MRNGTCQPFDVCPGLVASNSISSINDVKVEKILSAVMIAILM